MIYIILVCTMAALVAATYASIKGLRTLHNTLHYGAVLAGAFCLADSLIVTGSFGAFVTSLGVLALAIYLWYDAREYDKERDRITELITEHRLALEKLSELEKLAAPEVGDHFTETWSLKEVIVTRADQAQVTTMTTEENSHKAYPLSMFWELHARL